MTDAERLRKLMIMARPSPRSDPRFWKAWNDAIGDDPRATWRCPECCTLQCMRWCRHCGHDSDEPAPVAEPQSDEGAS